MQRMTKTWLWVAVPAGLLAGVWLWQAARPDAAVEVVAPYTADLQAFVEERAVTELPHDHLISMPIAGWMPRIDLREGDAVHADQVILQLETGDLEDRVAQARQRIAVLESEIAANQDNRLEDHMLVEANAVVKAIGETVQAAEVQLEGSLAIHEFAKSELQRLMALSETGRANERELAEAKTESRKSGADYRSDVLNLAALRTLAAVSDIGPKFITDYTDRKRFELERWQRQLDEARTQLEIEQRNLNRAVIRSPIDGIVLTRDQTRRQYLPAGTPLLTVGRLDELEIVAEVLTEQAGLIEPGAAVEVFGSAIPQGTPHGTVLRVFPAGFTKVSSLGIEQQRVKVVIKLDQRPERLGVGFRVHVRILYAQAKGVLALPRTCLFRSPQGIWQVMALRQGRTVRLAVEVGLLSDDEAQIKGGLTAGDLVVRHPSKDIDEGMTVRAVLEGGPVVQARSPATARSTASSSTD